MILDGGAVEIGLESTILDMTVTPPMILRPGAITAEMFEEVIGKVDVDETLLVAESEKAPKAPGMKYRHYAPKAKLMIVRRRSAGGDFCDSPSLHTRLIKKEEKWGLLLRQRHFLFINTA